MPSRKTELDASVGRRMEQHAYGLRLTGEQVAEQMGVTQGTVSRWFSGKSTPSRRMVQLFARLFDANEEYLLLGKRNGTPEEAFEKFAFLVAKGVPVETVYREILGKEASAETAARLRPAAEKTVAMLREYAARELHLHSSEELLDLVAVVFRHLQFPAAVP